MAAFGYFVVVSPDTGSTLLWQTSTGVAPDPAINPAAGIFRAGTVNDPVPILVQNNPAASNNLLIGGNGTEVIALAPGASIPFNVVGNDSLYATCGGPTNAYILVMRQ